MTEGKNRNRFYEAIFLEAEDGLCEDIPEDVCRDEPKNFLLNALNGMGTKFADQLANPGLVLPWFLDAMGTPTSLTGFLLPVRRAGALLPQLFVSGYIRKFPVRKWFWLVGGVIFGLSLLLMVPVAIWLSPLAAGIGILILLAIGSIGRGYSSVAFKEVLAKTIPEGRRGRLLSIRAMTGGVLALIAGVILRTQVGSQDIIYPYLIMIGLAGALWIGSALLVTLIREQEGATKGARDIFQELRSGFVVLRREGGFRQFISARVVLLSIELSLPYFALYARRITSGGAGDLGVFVITASLAQVLSSPFWGWFADRSSRLTLMVSSGMAGLAGIIMLFFNYIPAIPISGLILAIPIMIIGFSIAGVRLGRKTYLVDAVPEGDRPLYFAVSNTITGFFILLAGGLGYLVDLFGIQNVILVLTLSAFISLFISWKLSASSEMV